MFTYLAFLLPGILLSLWASARVQSAFHQYSGVMSQRGYTGAQAAQRLLNAAGIHDVRIVPTNGFLSDNYNPMTKELSLSEQVYASHSIAAVGVATHEAGHAIQHAHNYAPMWMRSAIVGPAQIGSTIGPWVIFAGFAMQMMNLVIIGIVFFSMVLVFQLITLPVEFDASNRAKRLIVDSGIISMQEREGVDTVLNAAAWTYVAGALTTFMQLLYYLVQAGLLGNRRQYDE
jgi:Zn-dependent membrane protease YugP